MRMLGLPSSAVLIRCATSVASNGSATNDLVSGARCAPTRSAAWPMRWYGDSALGLAYTTAPALSMRISRRPPRAGVHVRRRLDGRKVPSEIIWHRSAALPR